ncbi:MAG: DUF523 and DUF1722 domain-containing protein [Gammaproteobacteria bacterium]|nr:DUF523 and DUF1722 domain-containing protein [Gammaproteobacteria bacterium]
MPDTKPDIEKIPVGISSCLLGEPVRYDGAHKLNSYIVNTLGDYFDFVPFCPEMHIGLGVPREPIRLVEQEDKVRCIGTQTATLDVTDQLVQCANTQQYWHATVFGYILKQGSPSCGMEQVNILRNNTLKQDASGIYAHTMMQNFPALPVEEEGRLGDPVLRENFMQRVCVYSRWDTLQRSSLDKSALCDFHARHKLILYSHDQDQARALGKALADCAAKDIPGFAQNYLTRLMTILKIPATRNNHVNVLQHIQGYLKTVLSAADKQELAELIEAYRLGQAPLNTPLTLLRHHFRSQPDEYINNSYYMNPHPLELMLSHSL